MSLLAHASMYVLAFVLLTTRLEAGLPGQPGCPDKEATLAKINEKRALHGRPPVVWDDSMVPDAQAWVDHLAPQNCGLAHAPNIMETLAGNWMDNIKEPQCARAVDMWYDEINVPFYFTSTPYASNLFQYYQIGHMVSLIWNATTKVACASSVGPAYLASKGIPYPCYVIVCRYDPGCCMPIESDWQKNVFPLVAKPPPAVSSPPPDVSSPPPDVSSPPPEAPPPAPPAADACQDNPDYPCAQYAQSGYCVESRFVDGLSVPNQVCPLSCATCVTCVDRVSTDWCVDWVRQGFCASEYYYDNVPVSEQCKLTCGVCTPTVRRKLADGEVATDIPYPSNGTPELVFTDDSSGKDVKKPKKTPLECLKGAPVFRDRNPLDS